MIKKICDKGFYTIWNIYIATLHEHYDEHCDEKMRLAPSL
jgi:hypothetical protein